MSTLRAALARGSEQTQDLEVHRRLLDDQVQHLQVGVGRWQVEFLLQRQVAEHLVQVARLAQREDQATLRCWVIHLPHLLPPRWNLILGQSEDTITSLQDQVGKSKQELTLLS